MISKVSIGISWRDGFHAVRVAAPAARSAWNRTLQAFGIAALLVFAGSVFAAGTGTVDKVSGWYPAGTNVTVTATPSTYSAFDRWMGETNGAAIAGAQISFNVTSARSVTAVFKDRLTQTNSVPYWWLAGQGITTNFESAVTADPDNDSFTTAEEYWSGTDPQDSASFLHITGVQMVGTNVRLSWAHSRVDTNIPPICIQSRSSMITGSWINAGERLPANGMNTWDGSLPSQRFYRLCVTNVP